MISILFLVVALLFTGGVIYLRYKVLAWKELLVSEISRQLGGKLNVGRIIPNGLRGVRIDDIRLQAQKDGLNLELSIPYTYVTVNWVNLLYGDWNFERIQFTRADLNVEFKDRAWLERIRSFGGSSSLPRESISFRVIGTRSTVRVKGLIPEHEIIVRDLDFESYRLPDSAEFRLKLQTKLMLSPEMTEEQAVQCDLRFRSIEDFDLRFSAGTVTLSQIAKFVEFPPFIRTSGRFTPSIRVSGYPNNTWVFGLESTFEDLTVVTSNMTLESLSGELVAIGDYRVPDRRLRITTAEIRSEEVDGNISGTVHWGRTVPEVDLIVEVRKIPLEDILQTLTEQQIKDYGDFQITFDQLNNLRFGIRGEITHPIFEALADVTNGELQFSPREPNLPVVRARLELVKLGWSTESQLPKGTLLLKDGVVDYKSLGIYVSNITATCVLDGDQLTIDSLSGLYDGSPITIKGVYAIFQKSGSLTINGSLYNLERLPFIKEDGDVFLRGSATFNSSVQFSLDKVVLELSTDLTSAEVGYEWWFRKRLGMGATISNLKATIQPKKSLLIEAKARLESIPLDGRFEYLYQQGKFQLRKVDIATDSLDISTASNCLRIPYTGRGGVGKNGRFHWEKTGRQDKWGTMMKIGVEIDWASFLAQGTTDPIEAKKISVQATIDDRDPKNRTRLLNIVAEEAKIPPIGVKWILPLRDKAEAEAERLRRKEPIPPPEYWTFVLSADRLTMLPWEGTKFRGIAYDKPEISGLERFSAEVGSGTVEGSFSVTSPENVSSLKAKWRNIPVVYLLRHLELPEAVEGLCTGEVDYTLDLDDPNTLLGKANFVVMNGKVKTDLFLTRFAPDLSPAGFPPTLPFILLSSNVEMERDLIKTPNVRFQSEGLQMEGKGQFFIDGDMDYDLFITLSPQLASRIPVIRESFNIRGHQIIQNPIQLGFRIHGPSFGPKGQVKELPPLGVTLVSGAAEITTEALRVIDIPRKILLDLLKIGGGVIGSTTTPR